MEESDEQCEEQEGINEQRVDDFYEQYEEPEIPIELSNDHPSGFFVLEPCDNQQHLAEPPKIFPKASKSVPSDLKRIHLQKFLKAAQTFSP